MENKKYNVNYKITVGGVLMEEKKDFCITSNAPDNIDGVNILLSELDKESVVSGITKKITIPPSLAYGKHSEQLKGGIPKTLIYENCDKEDYVLITLKDGSTRSGQVKKVNKESVIVDCNHPLVDKTLDLELEVIN